MPPCTTTIDCRFPPIPTGKTVRYWSLLGVISQFTDLLNFYKEDTVIQDLDSSSYEIIKPIPVIVQEEDGMFITSLVEANINASGENQNDAMQMLKSSIVSRFRFYSKNEVNLGAGPQRQLAVLRQFVREK